MRSVSLLSLGLMSLLLAGCWNSDPATSTTVGGSVSGLSGTVTVVLNGGESRAISSNGPFGFQSRLQSGAQYSVSVSSQPATQTCVVANGSGMVGRTAVTTVAVTCTTHEYSIGGTVTGLNGTLELRNGAEVLSLSSTGAFNFPARVPTGSTYAVTVQTQPIHQTCIVNRGSGTMGSNAIADIEVACATDTFTVAGSLSGLVTGLVSDVELQLNGTDTVTVSSNGTFSFPTPSDVGTSYSVILTTQPTVPAQTCTVGNGTGVGLSNVTNVTVTCALPTPRFAFVSRSSGNAAVYAVDEQSGDLTPAQTTSITNALFLTLSPDNRFLYAPERTQNRIHTYSVDPLTAQLTEVGGSPVATGTSPRMSTRSADGRWVHVVNQFGDSLSTYAADATTGALTPTGGTVATNSQPVQAQQSPDGRFLYVFNFTSSNIKAFAHDANTGALTTVGSYAAPGFSSNFAIDPRGKFLYVSGRNFNVIYSFAIDPDTGALSAANSPVAVGGGPTMVAVDPSNRFLYATHTSNNISAYTIEPVSGALTEMPGSPFAMPSMALSVSIDPSGKFVYFTYSSGIASYRILSSGALTATPGSPMSLSSAFGVTLLAR